MPKNTKGLEEFSKSRTELAEKKVLEALNTLRKEGAPFKLSKVAEIAGVSTNFIYTHPDILKTVKKYTEPTGRKKKQTEESKDVLVSCLREENRKLKQEIKALKSNENYKEKCAQLEEKIKELQIELENAYNNGLDLNY